MNFVRIISITIATSIAVFLGLELFLPRHKDEKANKAAGVSADQVFANNAAPPASGSVPAAGEPAASPAAPSGASPSSGGKELTQTPTDPNSEPAEVPLTAETGAAVPPATPSPTTVAAQSSAGSSSGTSSAAAPSDPNAGLSDSEARKIAEDVSRQVANRVVDEKTSTPAPAPAASESAPTPAPSYESASNSGTSSGSSTELTEADVRRIAAEEARRVMGQGGGRAARKAKTETAQVTERAPAPAAEPAPAAAPAPTAPPASAEPPKTEVASTESAMPASPPKSHAKTKAAKGEPATDAISAWWSVTDKPVSGRLNLLYAGEVAQQQKTGALLFDNSVDGAAASGNIDLLDAKGGKVSGNWETGSNPRMLLFKNLATGRYTVVVKPELTGAGGQAIASGLHGPIYIH